MKSLSTNRAVQRTAAVVGGAALLFMSLPVAAAHAEGSGITVDPDVVVAIDDLTPAVGDVLTASATGFSPATPTVSYQWQSCTSAAYAADATARSGQCDNITSATAAAFTVPASLGGKFLRVVATANTSQKGFKALTVAVPESNQTAGTVSLTATNTSVAVAVGGTWVPADSAVEGEAYTYKSYASDGTVTDVTLSSNAFTGSAGSAYKLEVTRTVPGYKPVSVMSDWTEKLTTGALTGGDLSVSASATPATVGTVLTANTNTSCTGSSSGAGTYNAWTQTLSQGVSSCSGTDIGGVTLSYQWFANNAAIAGATSSTYTVKASDLDKVIRVRVTATRANYAPVSKTAVGLNSTASVPAFQNVGPVVITGEAAVGKTLTADTSAVGATAWKSGATLSYQWYKGNDPISGATDKTYTPVAADAGSTIKVGVVGSSFTGYDQSLEVVSGATAVIGTAQVAGDVVISGVAKLDNTLTATVKQATTATQAVGEWRNGATLKIQWYADGVKLGEEGTIKVSGGVGIATSPDLNKLGAKITAKVTAGVYTDTSVTPNVTLAAVSKTSAEYGPVLKAQSFANGAAPTISGTVKTGETLTATLAAASWPVGATKAYQWYRVSGEVWTAIKTATGATYTLQGADYGLKVKVTAVAKQTGYADAESTASTATDVVGIAAQAGTVTVKGAATPGQRLSAVVIGFAKDAELTYKWFVVDPATGYRTQVGSNATYTVTEDDLGSAIVVAVKSVATGYNDGAASAETAVVSKTVTSSVKVSFTSSKSSTLKASSKSALSNKVELAGSGLTKIQVTGYGKTSSIAKARAAAIVKYLKSEGVTSVSSSYKKSSSSSKAVFTYVTTN